MGVLRAGQPDLCPQAVASDGGAAVALGEVGQRRLRRVFLCRSADVGSPHVPVFYEIYKGGTDPFWEEGLDLLGPIGLHVAVIPHYDNTEGGTHDTRYCYLGEDRLEAMEAQLSAGEWVLGVDEHTVCVFDLVARTASVLGLGSVTIRAHGVRSSSLRARRWQLTT